MSTHNIYFRREIRKILYRLPLLSGALFYFYSRAYQDKKTDQILFPVKQ